MPAQAPDSPGEVTVDAVDGIVRMRLTGSPSAARLRASFVPLRELLARHSPRLLLIDGSGVTKTTGEMREVLRSEASSVEFDRQAIIGIPPAERVFARIVARLTFKHDRMQFYATEAEALRWLNELRGPR